MDPVACSPVRHADWRFLLPSPAGGTFSHLLVLGGSAVLESALLELGVARRVSRSPRPGEPVDALIVLAGATEPIETALDQLDANGVLYWEVDRRAPHSMLMTPGRARRLLERCGVTTACTYVVKPGFPHRHMFLPVDAPAALHWYLDTLYRAKSLSRRLLGILLRAAGWRPRGLESIAPCYAVTAVRGPARQPALITHAARQGVRVTDRALPVLVAQGDFEWNRIAMLLFEPDAASPEVLLKLPRRSIFNDHIESEHACLRDLARRLPPALRVSVPASALFEWNDLAVATQNFVSGRNLHSRAARGAQSSRDDVRLAAEWLADFHTSTATSHVAAGEWLAARIDQQATEYAQAYGLTADEHHLFASVSRQLEMLDRARLPIVWQHGDFGPWNIYRDRDRLSVIDWETARAGPAMVDLLYFVTQWSFEFDRCESNEAQCRRLEALFCRPSADDAVAATIRMLIETYLSRVGMPAALLPALLVYTFLEQAIDRSRRLRTVEAAQAPGRAANCYVAYLGVLARHADVLFGRAPVLSTPRADITVAVATRNRPAQLARCIEALLNGQTIPAEVVIIDQSDDTRTAETVERADWSGRVVLHYRRLTSRGLAASRNAAIASANFRVIAFTDDDCVPDAGWMRAIASAFDGPSEPAAVTGRILPLGPDRPGFYAVATRDSRIPAVYAGRSLPWVVGSGGNTAVRRDWLERIGGFDERLGAGGPGRAAEDTDLLYRLLRSGATIRYEPDAVILHERKDAIGQLASRPAYGFGMGAFCALWVRRRDAYAAWMLANWCVDRSRRLLGGCARRRWRRVREELLMLGGAWRGLAYGLKVGLHE